MRFIDRRNTSNPRLRETDFLRFGEAGSVFIGKVIHNSGTEWDVVDLETGDRLMLNCECAEELQAKLESNYVNAEVIPHNKVTITFE